MGFDINLKSVCVQWHPRVGGDKGKRRKNSLRALKRMGQIHPCLKSCSFPKGDSLRCPPDFKGGTSSNLHTGTHFKYVCRKNAKACHHTEDARTDAGGTLKEPIRNVGLKSTIPETKIQKKFSTAGRKDQWL